MDDGDSARILPRFIYDLVELRVQRVTYPLGPAHNIPVLEKRGTAGV